jgi:hypothetical protein
MLFSTGVPRQHVDVGPVKLDRLSVCMLKEAERIGDFKLQLVQGSFNPGGVAASAGTHDGGGALDASVRGLKPDQIRHRVHALRHAGWAAWHRHSPPFSGPHIHAIAIGNPLLAAGARAQVQDYKNGRNGLADRGRDPDPRVDPKFYSEAFLSRYVRNGHEFADLSILVFVSQRFQNTGKEFTSATSRKHIKLVQAALKEMDLYPFTVDGKWGPKTNDSYAQWRARLGVKHPTGLVRRSGLVVLGHRTGNFGVKA